MADEQQQVLPFGGDFDHDVPVDHALRQAMQMNKERGFSKILMLFEDEEGGQSYFANHGDPQWQAYILHRALKNAVD